MSQEEELTAKLKQKMVYSDDDKEEEDQFDEYDDEEDQNLDDWIEDEEIPAVSLLTRKECKSIQEALEQDKKDGFDFIGTCLKLGLDMYQGIRFVNYIRSLDSVGAKDLEKVTRDSQFLQDDNYLQPVMEDDAYLQIDIDEFMEESNTSAQASTSERTIETLERKIAGMDITVSQLQQFIRDQLETTSSTSSTSTTEKPKEVKRDDDTHYFDSYSTTDIHQLMLQDKVRTESYRDFVYGSKSSFENAIVMDVGCGTGILSMFAAKAGAKHVYAIDASGVADKAKRNVQENGLQDVITVIKGKVEEITLPVDKVDIIISEWMGYFLLYESMFDSVLYARDKYLATNGIMAPDRCTIMMGAYSDDEFVKENITFWDDVYGFKMPSMGEDIYKDATITVTRGQGLVSKPVVLKDFEAAKCTPQSVDFSSDFEICPDVKEPTRLDGFVGYFDTFFNSVRSSSSSSSSSSLPLVTFSTGPQVTPTHWKQTLFLIDPKNNKITINPGDTIKGTFTCKKSTDNSRELNVDMIFNIISANSGTNMFKDPCIQSWCVR